jgi:hypothetical protein
MDLLEMLSLVSPAGEYFPHTTTKRKQYNIQHSFLRLIATMDCKLYPL